MPEDTTTNAQGQTLAGVQLDFERWPETNGLAPIAGAESQPGATPPPAPPAQATPPADPSQGEGEPTGGTGEGGFNWGLFPGVPEDQRETLQPHLQDVERHVNGLNQQMASLKPLLDQGVTPDQLAPLIEFDTGLQSSPIETFIKLAQGMAERSQDPQVREGFGSIDWDAMKQMLSGQDVAEPGGGGAIEGQEDNPLMPVVQQLQQQVAELQSNVEQDQTTRRQFQEDAMLTRSVDSMRTQLGEAGLNVPEQVQEGQPGYEQYQQFEKVLVSSLITNDGDPQKAVQSLVGFRDGILKGFTQTRETTTEGTEPETPKGAPNKSDRSKKGRDSDGFRAARAGASQYLKKQQAAQSS